MKQIYTLCALTAFGISVAGATSVPVHKASLPSLSQYKSFFKAPLKSAPIDAEVIYDTPEGEETLLASSSDAFQVEGYEAIHSQVYGSGVKMVTDGDDVYFSHLVAEYPIDTWVVGKRTGNQITIEGGQPVYEYYDFDTDEVVMIYLVPMQVKIDDNNQGTFYPTDENVFTFNVASDGTITSSDPEMLLGLCSYGDVSDSGTSEFYWGGFGDRNITMKPVTAQPVVLPEGLKPEGWVFSDEYETGLSNVAISGNDIYVQGMCRNMKEAWVKGTIEGDKAKFPSAQYLGYDAEIFYVAYFMGADDVTDSDGDIIAALAPEAVFSYNADEKVLKTENGYMANGDNEILFPLYIYSDVTIANQNRNPNTPPAAPYDLCFTPADDWDPCNIWVQIPNTDIDGKLLDESNLYYQIFVDGELFEFTTEDYFDLPENTNMLPYNFQGYDVYVEGTDHTIYLYTEADHYVSMRSVYINENGEKLYSATTMETIDGIAANWADKEVESVEYYNLQGIRVPAADKGMVINVIKYTDGTRRIRKIINNN